MTVVADGVVVEKRIDLESMPLPAISFQIASERSEPVDVTVVDEVPDAISPEHVAFHPEYDGDRWTVYGDGELVWRDTLAPGERRRTLYGVWLSDPRTIRSWLTPPTIDAVRAVAADLDPLVVDESFVSSQGDAFGGVKAGVADIVPEDALITDPTAPAATEVPAGDTADLEPPTRNEVQRVVASLDLADSAVDHDRYYLVRVDVGRRGDAETTVLEELTNALSVLHADAERRGDDAQVFDVAISTNWQAERIVTALVDDPRIDGLLVTELTGAVARRQEIETRDATHNGTPPTHAYPDAADYADAVFGAVADAATDDPIVAPAVDEAEPTPSADAGSDAPGANDETVISSADAETDTPTADGARSAGWADSFEQNADGFDAFEPADITASTGADAADSGTDAAGDAPAEGDQFADDPFDEDPFADDPFEDADAFGAFDAAFDDADDPAATGEDDTEGSATADDEPPIDLDTVVGRDDRDTNEEDMAAFEAIQAETEQAGIDELDAELAEMELSPSESGESVSIQDLVDEYDDDDDGERSLA